MYIFFFEVELQAPSPVTLAWLLLVVGCRSGFVTFSDIAATERAIHFIDNKYTLNAPSYPQQKPIYMKYAKLSRSAAAP